MMLPAPFRVDSALQASLATGLGLKSSIHTIKTLDTQRIRFAPENTTSKRGSQPVGHRLPATSVTQAKA